MCSPTLVIIFSGRQSDLFFPLVEFSAWSLYLPVPKPEASVTYALNLQPHGELLLLILILRAFTAGLPLLQSDSFFDTAEQSLVCSHNAWSRLFSSGNACYVRIKTTWQVLI